MMRLYRHTCSNFDWWLIFTYTLHWPLQCYDCNIWEKSKQNFLWQNFRFGNKAQGKITDSRLFLWDWKMQFCVFGNLQDIIIHVSLRKSNEWCSVRNFQILVRFSRKVWSTSTRTKQQLHRFKLLLQDHTGDTLPPPSTNDPQCHWPADFSCPPLSRLCCPCKIQNGCNNEIKSFKLVIPMAL